MTGEWTIEFTTAGMSLGGWMSIPDHDVSIDLYTIDREGAVTGTATTDNVLGQLARVAMVDGPLTAQVSGTNINGHVRTVIALPPVGAPPGSIEVVFDGHLEGSALKGTCAMTGACTMPPVPCVSRK